jgi:hypothetical protein
LPGESADRMRGKRYQIRRDPEKEHAVVCIIRERFQETGKVSFDSFPQPRI